VAITHLNEEEEATIVGESMDGVSIVPKESIGSASSTDLSKSIAEVETDSSIEKKGFGDKLKKAGNSGKHAAIAAGHAIKSGLMKAGHILKKGAKKIAHHLKKGAKKAAHHLKKGAKKAGRRLKKGAKRAFGALKRGAKKLGNKLKNLNLKKSIKQGVQKAKGFLRILKRPLILEREPYKFYAKEMKKFEAIRRKAPRAAFKPKKKPADDDVKPMPKGDNGKVDDVDNDHDVQNLKTKFYHDKPQLKWEKRKWLFKDV